MVRRHDMQNATKCPTSVSMRAFTLIELLAVTTITAVTIAMLIPSLHAARSSAKLIVCQQQLRQWGIAFHCYAMANKGVFPHTDGLDRDKSLADQFGWVDVLPPLMGQKPWRDHPFRQRPASGTIFQCPAAELADDDLYKYYPRIHGYFSYAMNSCLELDENCWPPYTGGGWPMPSFLRTSRIAEPTQVVLLFDQLLDPKLGYDATTTYPKAGKYCGSYPKSFSARHPRSGSTLGGSLLFCDGHVGWTHSIWKDHWPADLEVPPRDDRDWYPYLP